MEETMTEAIEDDPLDGPRCGNCGHFAKTRHGPANRGLCRRYPSFVDRAAADVCGEHSMLSGRAEAAAISLTAALIALRDRIAASPLQEVAAREARDQAFREIARERIEDSEPAPPPKARKPRQPRQTKSD